ncbi:caspase family protein [Streptomyces niveiscabiei]|uniref:AAA family ATPase n=1 Tax=Streptomyces niveiscabiei TaxID=164115 RepID=UPI0029A1173B|nr:AAA family ATPase [Streptomyces niveiscabiei]MDX3388102.1 caspase family protein [Streptomyces niveiscabiei]
MVSGMGRRRALVVGIAEFAADSRTAPDAEEAIGSAAWPPLPEAGDWADRAAAVLDELGYQVTLLAGEKAPTAADLGAAVTRTLQEAGPDDVVIVHVITHGDQPADLDTVYAIGADGRRDEACNVDTWVRTVVAGGDARPRTLFLLDFCRSGVAAVPRWHRRPFQASNRAWVLAASAPDSDAFDCAFSRAVVQTLREVAAGDFCTHPSRLTVPYLAVSARIRDVVADGDGDDVLLPIQEPTGTPIDTMTAARLDLPFFPNPDHRRVAFDDALAAMDDRLAEFAREVDHLVDPRHFRDRAAARWEAGRRPGLFQGRERELRALSASIDGAGAAAPWIVTGSPGVGKSALLGVLVCAAHPTLRHATEEVWGHLPAPAATPHLAAVHARQQAVDAITASLLTQLAPEPAAEPEAPASVGALLEAVTGRPVAPVIVIDSLDEAIDSEELSARLVVPLARARRADGSAACRLIVGMRPWEEFEPLRRAVALAGGTVLDLDQVPAAELAENLRVYVQRVLRAGRWYGSVDGHGFVTAIADGVAATLTRTGDAQPRWGGFLIARLFAEYVAHTLPPVTDQDQAERLLAQIPASLPEVLEMSLRRPEAGPWMRPVLAALAHARGVGMPPKIIQAVAPLYAPQDLGPPSTRDVRRALADGRFYLRQSADVSGTSVFRLYHESLVEYLRAHPRAVPADAAPEPAA